MVIAVIGASGSIGKVLVNQLEQRGESVICISRKVRSGWRQLEPQCLEGADAVVNLAGESIDKRWNARNKEAFWQSRVVLSQQIATWISQMDSPPKVWVNASAIGIYGDGCDEVFDESSPTGEGYLATLCEQWEKAAQADDVRVVHARIGVVLGKSTMAWQRMAKVFSLGVGGPLGSGKQWFPWVHMNDVVGGIIHALDEEKCQGALNLVAPEPLRNRDFSRILAKAYAKPAFLAVPALALRLTLGGFASALLASYRVEPLRLKQTGYQFKYENLQEALQDLVS